MNPDPNPGPSPGRSRGRSPADGPVALLRPMRKVIRVTGIGLAAAIPLAVGIGWLIDGSAGAWGAVLGLAMPIAFFTITAAVALMTARSKPEVLGAAVLSSWLLKIVILMAFLALIRDQDFYNSAVLFGFLLVGTVGYLVMEAVIILRTKVPYLEPYPSNVGTPSASSGN